MGKRKVRVYAKGGPTMNYFQAGGPAPMMPPQAAPAPPAPQGGMPPQQASQETDALMELVMMYAQIVGQDPQQIMQQLMQLPENELQAAIQEMANAVAESGAMDQAPQGPGMEQGMPPEMAGQQPMHQMPDGTMMPGATHEGGPEQVNGQPPMDMPMAMDGGAYAKKTKRLLNKKIGGVTPNSSDDVIKNRFEKANLALARNFTQGLIENASKGFQERVDTPQQMFNIGGTANYYGDPNVMGSYTVNPGVADMYNKRLAIANAINANTKGPLGVAAKAFEADYRAKNNPKYKKINYELTGDLAENSYATPMDAMFDIERPTKGTIYGLDMDDFSKNPSLFAKRGGQPCFECGGSLKRYQGADGSSEVEEDEEKKESKLTPMMQANYFNQPYIRPVQSADIVYGQKRGLGRIFTPNRNRPIESMHLEFGNQPYKNQVATQQQQQQNFPTDAPGFKPGRRDTLVTNPRTKKQQYVTERKAERWGRNYDDGHKVDHFGNLGRRMIQPFRRMGEGFRNFGEGVQDFRDMFGQRHYYDGGSYLPTYQGVDEPSEVPYLEPLPIEMLDSGPGVDEMDIIRPAGGVTFSEGELTREEKKARRKDRRQARRKYTNEAAVLNAKKLSASVDATAAEMDRYNMQFGVNQGPTVTAGMGAYNTMTGQADPSALVAPLEGAAGMNYMMGEQQPGYGMSAKWGGSYATGGRVELGEQYLSDEEIQMILMNGGTVEYY